MAKVIRILNSEERLVIPQKQDCVANLAICKQIQRDKKVLIAGPSGRRSCKVCKWLIKAIVCHRWSSPRVSQPVGQSQVIWCQRQVGWGAEGLKQSCCCCGGLPIKLWLWVIKSNPDSVIIGAAETVVKVALKDSVKPFSGIFYGYKVVYVWRASVPVGSADESNDSRYWFMLVCHMQRPLGY